jgi:ankyrin repeat protein
MSASLLCLANELLLLIANCLESEHSINALARTNRRLYFLLNNHLYKQNVLEAESSVLQWAAYCGQESSAALSMAQGGNVNVRSNILPNFRRPLRSIHTTPVYITQDLLSSVGASSYTPLYISSILGHVKVVDLLIENGAEIESPLGSWATPLQAAAHCGQLQVVRLLIAKGVTIDKLAQDNSNSTTLHIACRKGYSAIAQVLIDAGADIMARDFQLDTPLHFVLKAYLENRSSTGHFRAVQWLLVSGADPHARNRNGETPFKLAMQSNSDVKWLFKKGLSIAGYEAGSQAYPKPEHESNSLQRLWAAYLDKQTEAATEAARAKRLQVEAAAQKQLAKQKLRLQRERVASLHEAENRKQAAERARREEEERSKSLRVQAEEQRAKDASVTQKQDAVRKAWVQMREKAKYIGTEGTSTSCQHASLTWNRRKGKGDCEFCHKAFANRFFFQCPDCATAVCQSCAAGRPRK